MEAPRVNDFWIHGLFHVLLSWPVWRKNLTPTRPQTLLPLPMLACYMQVLKSYWVDGTRGTVVRRALLFHVASLFLYGGSGVTNCDHLNSAVTLWPDLKIIDTKGQHCRSDHLYHHVHSWKGSTFTSSHRYYVALCLWPANWHNIQCTFLILSSKTICDPVAARLL